MADATPQPGGEGGAPRDPWAAPESGPSLEKSASPGADASAGQPSVHDQGTITSPPGDGFGAPGSAPAHGYPAPGPGGAPGPGPAGPVPPPPLAPGGVPGPPGAPGGYGYPGYPQGYGWGTPPMPPQNGMGVAAMVLGILSCVMFCMYGVLSIVLGIIAIVLGVKGRKRAERGEATNHGQAQAGFITGIIGTILGLAVMIFMIVVIVTAINSEDDSDSDYYYDGSLHAVSVSQAL